MNHPRLPIFTDQNGQRWGLGAEVMAEFWHRTQDEDGERMELVAEVGTVHRIVAGGEEGWLVEVTFGPLLDAFMAPGPLNPSQIQKLEVHG